MNSNHSFKKVYSTILVLSLIVVGFLVWLVYYNKPLVADFDITIFPLMNAIFNGLSFSFLVAGIVQISKGNKEAHKKMMMSAFLSSAFFFVSYVTYHLFQGEVKYTGVGFIRYVYFFILITHIFLSAVVVPLILTTFYFGLNEFFQKHKKIGRWTFYVWAYVSITGVIIYLMN
jgi:putative membrane protein